MIYLVLALTTLLVLVNGCVLHMPLEQSLLKLCLGCFYNLTNFNICGIVFKHSDQDRIDQMRNALYASCMTVQSIIMIDVFY